MNIPDAIEQRAEMLTTRALVVKDEGVLGVSSKEELKEAIIHHFNLREYELEVFQNYPEHFLVIFRSEEARNLVFARGRLVEGPFDFRFRLWNVDLHGDRRLLPFHVKISLEGLPLHAWFEEVAAKVVGDACAIHHVDRATRRREDLRAFVCWTFCQDPNSIPQVVYLTLVRRAGQQTPEAQVRFSRPRGMQRGHVYRIFIHTDSVEDLSFYHYPAHELMAEGSIQMRRFSWQFGLMDGNLDDDELRPQVYPCRPAQEPRRDHGYDDDDEDRARRHPRTREIISRVTHCLDGRDRSRNRTPNRENRSGWYRGEPSHRGRVGQDTKSPPLSRFSTPFAENRALRQLWQSWDNYSTQRCLTLHDAEPVQNIEHSTGGPPQLSCGQTPSEHSNGYSDAIQITPMESQIVLQDEFINAQMGHTSTNMGQENNLDKDLGNSDAIQITLPETVEQALKQWEEHAKTQKDQVDRWVRIPGSDAIVVPLSPVFWPDADINTANKNYGDSAGQRVEQITDTPIFTIEPVTLQQEDQLTKDDSSLTQPISGTQSQAEQNIRQSQQHTEEAQPTQRTNIQEHSEVQTSLLNGQQLSPAEDGITTEQAVTVPTSGSENSTDLITTLKQSVISPISPPILKTPAHKSTNNETTSNENRSPNMVSPGNRSSPRLPGKPKKQISVVKMAQQVLAKKWGVLEEDEELENDKIKKYLDIYKKPLSEPEMEAIRTLSEVVEMKKKRKKHYGKTNFKIEKNKKSQGIALEMQSSPITMTEA